MAVEVDLWLRTNHHDPLFRTISFPLAPRGTSGERARERGVRSWTFDVRCSMFVFLNQPRHFHRLRKQRRSINVPTGRRRGHTEPNIPIADQRCPNANQEKAEHRYGKKQLDAAVMLHEMPTPAYCNSAQ